MKNVLVSLSLLGLLVGGVEPAVHGNESRQGALRNQITITIGSKVFTATLIDNPAATAFKAMLPLSVKMSDLNNNEKVVRLAADLPAQDANPGRIQSGDLMLWNSRSLVLFYQSFPTSYQYTRLGRIEDATGLSAAVGSGTVTVTYELKAGR